MFDESEPESNSSLSDAAAESSEQEPRGTGAEGDADAASPQVMNGPATIAADNAATPKRISQKKIEANQRNGRLSPGPRTAQGKKVASRNAVKWGLTTNFLITQGPRREDPQEFEQIL